MELIAKVFAAAAAGVQAGGGLGGGSGKAIVRRSYDLTVAFGTQSPDLQKMLDVIEEHTGELDLNKAKALGPTRADRMNSAQRSAEFQILVFKTDGEAKLIVKSVGNQETVGNQDGIRAVPDAFEAEERSRDGRRSMR